MAARYREPAGSKNTSRSASRTWRTRSRRYRAFPTTLEPEYRIPTREVPQRPVWTLISSRSPWYGGDLTLPRPVPSDECHQHGPRADHHPPRIKDGADQTEGRSKRQNQGPDCRTWKFVQML